MNRKLLDYYNIYKLYTQKLHVFIYVNTYNFIKYIQRIIKINYKCYKLIFNITVKYM